MPDIEIRRASEADLSAVYRVWRAAARPGHASPAPPNVMGPLLRHEFASGELWVAVVGGEIVGYTAALVRSGVAFIAELFVAPDRQAQGIGGALLRQLLAAVPATAWCTMSSSHPGALTLYVRAGLRPRWPHFFLTGTAAAPAHMADNGVTAVEAQHGDPGVVAWDANVSGWRRPEDHVYWQQVLAAAPLWFRRGGHPVGCGYLRRCVRHDDGGVDVRLGPLGVVAPGDAVACIAAAWRWAGIAFPTAPGSSNRVRYCVAVPEPHGALAPLLEAGFRISDTEIFCSSRHDLGRDPLRYLAQADPEGTSVF